MLEYSATSFSGSGKISNRQLKRIKAYMIASYARKLREEQAIYSKQARYKSGSWITVPPRPKATDRHKINYNKGDYRCYKTNTGMWLTR